MRRAAGHGRHGAGSGRALGPARVSAAAARLATVAPRSLSIAQARRAALAASGLQASLPGSRAAVGTRAMAATIARLGLLQLDTVNVFERSHYLPLLARLGPYDRGALDRLVRHDLAARPRVRTLGAYTEAWAHEAAIVPVADWPLLRFRADAFRAANADWFDAHRDVCASILADVAARGPLTAPEIDHPDNVRLGGGWWNKNVVHRATHALFRSGELVTIGRRRFERVYDVAERALPDASAVDAADARRELVRRAARAHGVATLDDLRDHYRIRTLREAAVAVDELVEAGEIEELEVRGWDRPAYALPGLRIPRSVEATALLSPFDPIVWHRPRALRLWDLHYRISIYTPAEQREHGYYVLPVLVDDAIVGRVDLKSDRRAGVLRVQHAHVEPAHADRAGALAERLAPALAEAAAWQGLGAIEVAGPGTWAREVAAAVVSD